MDRLRAFVTFVILVALGGTGLWIAVWRETISGGRDRKSKRPHGGRREGRARRLAVQAAGGAVMAETSVGLEGGVERWKREVGRTPWESGPEGCSDGRLEAAWCQGPGGGAGEDASAPHASRL